MTFKDSQNPLRTKKTPKTKKNWAKTAKNPLTKLLKTIRYAYQRVFWVMFGTQGQTLTKKCKFL